MVSIQKIFVEYGPAYLARFAEAMPEHHKKAIEAIMSCRTAACGMTIYDCPECGAVHHFYRSCGNRNCPNCQHQKALFWMTRQLENALPGHHFMVTFTVPREIRFFIRSHQTAAYNAMFRASCDTLKKLSADERHIGGDTPGFFGVLHTWGDEPLDFIRTSITWCRAEHFPAMTGNGIPLALISISRSRPCPKSTRRNFAIGWSRRG